MNTATPRYSTLPEDYLFLDTGCSYAPSCLACPFTKCRYDERSPPAHERAAKAVSLRSAGVPIDAIASQLGITRRTVGRILARSRR